MDLYKLIRFIGILREAEQMDEESEVMVVNLADLMRLPGDEGMIPPPNCDNPRCVACMALRQLRGTTIESDPGVHDTPTYDGPRPHDYDGPPIII